MMKPSPSRGTRNAHEKEQLLQRHASVEPSGVARWRAAEDRLYPLIVVDPDLYEGAVMLVHEVAQVLSRECGSVAELTNVEAARVLALCPSTSLTAGSGFDPGTAFDAARAHRFRELAASEPDAALEERQGGRS